MKQLSDFLLYKTHKTLISLCEKPKEDNKVINKRFYILG